MKKLLTLACLLCMAAISMAQETVSFTVFAGNKFGEGEGCQKAMDNDLDTKWGYYGSDNDQWIYFKTTDGSKIFLTGYTIVTANDNSTYGRLPKEWEIFGSNDENLESSATPENCSWTSIQYLRGDGILQKKNHTSYYYALNPSSTSYKYFRMKIVYGSGDDKDASKTKSFQISEFIPSYLKDYGTTYTFCSGEGGYYKDSESYDEAIDGNKETKWGKKGKTGTIVFGTSASVPVYGYTFTTGNDAKGRDPKSWTLYGKQANSAPAINDEGWVPIDTKTNQTMPDGRKTDCHFFVDSPTSSKYNYFKLSITDSREGGDMQFSEFKIDDNSERRIIVHNSGNKLSDVFPSNPPSNLFDGGRGDFHYHWAESHFIFGDARETPISISGYSIQTAYWSDDYLKYRPKSWTLYGSNDSKTNDGTWTVIHNVTDDTILPSNYLAAGYYLLDQPSDSYKYFKLVVNDTYEEEKGDDCYLEIGELVLFYDRGDISNWLELRDNTEPVFNGNVTVNNFKYTFSNDKKWGMICTPFALTGNDNISYYTPSKDASQWLEFSNSTTVAANTPALFNYPTAGNITLDGTNVQLLARPATISTTVGNWTMTGTKTTTTATNNYNIAGNDANEVQLSKSASTEVQPFRAYLTNSSLSEDAAYFTYDDLSKTIVVVEKENNSALESALSTAKAAANRSDALSALRTARKVANIETDNATYSGNEPAEGKFYIYNVGRKAYLTGGSDWGTHAALGYPGLLATLASNGGGYTVQFNELIQNDARDKYLNGSPYVDGADNSKTTYTFEAVGGKSGVYYIKDGDKYLAFDPDGAVDGGGKKHYNTVTKWDTASNEDAQWMLITKEDRLAQLNNASEQNPVDATVVIKDASFNKYAALNDPWTNLNQGWGWGDRNFGDKNTESYNSQEYNLSQTITVPKAGIYEVSVQSFYRDGDLGAHAARVVNGESLHAPGVLYAGTQEQPLVYIHEAADKAPGEGTNSDCGNFPNLMDQAASFFQNGLYWNRVRVTVPSDNSSLTIGIKKTGNDYRENDWIVADNFRLTYLGPTSESVSVTSAGYATYCSNRALDFSNTDIKAYVGTKNGDKLTFTPINQVPANTGLLLAYEGGKTENVPVIASASAIAENCLVGVNVETTIDGNDYILNKINDGVGFYKAGSWTTLGAHKAYIPAAVGNGVKGFTIDLDDDATGISLMEDGRSQMEDDAIYNVAGQRLSKTQKGINIVNGKKIAVK